MGEAFKALLRSRKFMALILDVVCSGVLFFVGKYATGSLEDVKFVILGIQPVFLFLIGGIAYEDGMQKRGRGGP